MTLRYAETSDAIVVFLTGFGFFDDAINLGPNSQIQDLCKLAESADKKLIIDLQPFELMNSGLLAMLQGFHRISASLRNILSICVLQMRARTSGKSSGSHS